jgi:hypothetical protein
MLYFLLKLYNDAGCIILPSRPLKMTKFAIEIHQKSMVARALPRTPPGAHDAPRSESGFVWTQVGRAIEKVGNPCYRLFELLELVNAADAADVVVIPLKMSLCRLTEDELI